MSSLRKILVGVALFWAVVLAVVALHPHPRRLKRVGWSLAAANVATLALLAASR